jgi:hypothetical protein
MAPQRDDQAFPNFYWAILGNSNGLERKKFGEAFPQSLAFVRSFKRVDPIRRELRL